MAILNLFTGSALHRQLPEKRQHLYRLAYAWCHDADLADDIAQEAMAKALQNQASLRDASRVDAWLYRILSNCWHDHLRRKRDACDIDDLVLSHQETPERHCRRDEAVAGVRAAVSRLPMGQRQVLTLVDLEEMSYAEVAEILDIPVGTVMSRLCRGRSALKGLLDAAMEPEPSRTAGTARLRRVK